jgi:hypothetical protein
VEAIFNDPRSKLPARIECWMLPLQPYNFRVIYKKGTVNEADYLSRHLTTTQRKTTIEEKIADNYVIYIINNSLKGLNPNSSINLLYNKLIITMLYRSQVTLQDIMEDLVRHHIKKVLECLKSEKWQEDAELKPCHVCGRSSRRPSQREQNGYTKSATRPCDATRTCRTPRNRKD